MKKITEKLKKLVKNKIVITKQNPYLNAEESEKKFSDGYLWHLERKRR